MSDPDSARRFISNDPTKDLEIDQAFGVPSFTPPSSNMLSASTGTMSPMNGGFMTDSIAAGALAQEFQQRQHLAALQFMNPLGLGLNPALLGGAALGARGPMHMLQMAGTGGNADSQGSSSTPISNYLANSSQGNGKVTGRSEAV